MTTKGFIKEKFQVMSREEGAWRTVEGWRLRDTPFAAYKEHRDWILIHTPTGRRVGLLPYRTLNDVKFAVEKLVEYGGLEKWQELESSVGSRDSILSVAWRRVREDCLMVESGKSRLKRRNVDE